MRLINQARSKKTQDIVSLRVEMTRLYYDDSYTREFEATVVEQTKVDDKPAVVLAQSYFYPTSGGQPCDFGRIGPASVIDVTIRESDEAVLHVLDKALEVGTYSAEIDWPRRFDLMQQHSGQHILSQAFIRTAEAATVGFHVGKESCTIDLDIKAIDPATLAQAEALANQIVWENRPIHTSFVPVAEAANHGLRKIPDVKGDKLRIVDIGDFDVTACGGTHVAATGGVGIIKVTKVDRIRKQVRIEFRCGQRAQSHYDNMIAITSGLAADFTCAVDDLPRVIANQRDEVKQARKTLKKQQGQLAQFEAQSLAASAESVGDWAVVSAEFPKRDPGDVRQLAQTMGRENGHIVLLAGDDALVFARAKDVDVDMSALLKPIIDAHSGRGGGSAQFAQATQLGMNSAELQAILATVVAEIQAMA